VREGNQSHYSNLDVVRFFDCWTRKGLWREGLELREENAAGASVGERSKERQPSRRAQPPESPLQYTILTALEPLKVERIYHRYNKKKGRTI